uniref:Myelin protein zero-like 2b n=1 Tax=Electrophorus electricus TaxID=8005 RepID=A0A4W4GLP2_ELEEL
MGKKQFVSAGAFQKQVRNFPVGALHCQDGCSVRGTYLLQHTGLWRGILAPPQMPGTLDGSKFPFKSCVSSVPLNTEDNRISAPKELKVVNGTEVELHCTFRSSQPHSKRLSVTWNFRPYGQTTEETIFYYQEMPYLPTDGRFKDHVVWTGDVQKNDASITLHGVQFAFNGTFSCKVQNPPDIQGYSGETVLQVIQSVKLSEIEILAAAVGGAIILVIFILIIFITVRYCRQDRNSTEVVLRDTEWKQPSVW